MCRMPSSHPKPSEIQALPVILDCPRDGDWVIGNSRQGFGMFRPWMGIPGSGGGAEIQYFLWGWGSWKGKYLGICC